MLTWDPHYYSLLSVEFAIDCLTSDTKSVVNLSVSWKYQHELHINVFGRFLIYKK